MTGSRRPLRGGFTLVELLVVIAIIAVLARLGFSAVQNFREKAKVATARGDMNQMDSGIGAFKSLFPSTNRVPSHGGDVTDATGAPIVGGPTLTKFRVRPRYLPPAMTAAGEPSDTSVEAQYLKRMYPRMDLNPTTAPAGSPIATYGTGLPNANLDPNQALVFFLGGYYLLVDPANVATDRRQVWGQGYLTNPTSPFLAAGALSSTPPTKPPGFEFPRNRLDVDLALLDTPPYPLVSGSGAPHLLDAWKTPYFYIAPTGDNAYVTFPYNAAVGMIQYINPEDGSIQDLNAKPLRASANKFENSRTHQIISAGRDKKFGFNKAAPTAPALWKTDPEFSDSRDGVDDLVNFRIPNLGVKD